MTTLLNDSDLGGSLTARLVAVARERPQKLAIETAEERVTYQQLVERSRSIAHSVRERVGGEPANVSLLFDRGVDFFASMMGVLGAGCRFIPLEPSNPVSRLQEMVTDSDSVLLLCEQAHVGLAQSLASHDERIKVQVAAEIACCDGLCEATLPSVEPSAESLIIYTSGSTGRPKGAVHTHESLLQNCLRRSRRVGVRSSDRFAQLEPASYIPAVTVSLLALMNGATLCPFPVHQRGVAELLRWIRAEEISMLRATPTLLRTILQAMQSNDSYPHLRGIQTGGETVRSSDIKLFNSAPLSGCSLFPTYGSSETGTLAMRGIPHGAEIESDPLPIGTHLEDVAIEIIGPDGAVVPTGEEGVITVYSRYFANRYWRRPDETSKAFQCDPETRICRYMTGDIGRVDEAGFLTHLGRIDSQVKVHGHRIECGEVESAILSSEGITACTVVPFVQHEDTQLAAYVVGAGLDDQFAKRLRDHLATRLPSHAIPHVFIPLGALPLNANGKVNRARLPAPNIASISEGGGGSATSAPARSTRRMCALLADVWQEVLEIPRPGVDDDFFCAGGDSLNGIELCLHLERRYNLHLPMTEIFHANTIRKQADLLKEGGERIRSESIVRLSRDDKNSEDIDRSTVLICVPGIAGHAWMFRYLAEVINASPAGSNVEVLGMNYPGLDGRTKASQRLDEIAESCRASLRNELKGKRVVIGGYSAGGLIAYELAQQLSLEGVRPSLLFLWDSFHPAVPMKGGRWLHAKRATKRWLRRMRTVGNTIPLIEQQLAEVVDGCRKAISNYKPSTYDGRVRLYLTKEEFERHQGVVSNAGWTNCCTGELATRQFDVPHIELFRPSAIDHIAGAVIQDLEAA